VLVFVFFRLFVFPRKKKLIVNPTEYTYLYKAYLYVDNQVYGKINKREEVSEEVIRKLLNRIPIEIRQINDLRINVCINSVLELQETVRTYKVCVGKEIIKQVDECIKFCDFTHSCIMLEVRAILCAQMRKSTKNNSH